MKTTVATFSEMGKPDTQVRILFEDGSFSFSVLMNEDPKHNLVAPLLPADRFLQYAEALQFVADSITSTLPGRMSSFRRGWNNLAADVHHNAKAKGFWPANIDERNNGELLCLIHSEISEALEALRKGYVPDDKLPEFYNVEVELADAVIRIMDLAHARGWRVAEAVEAKAKYNEGRAYKHGKKF